MRHNVEQFSNKKLSKMGSFNNREFRLAVAAKRAARRDEDYQPKNIKNLS